MTKDFITQPSLYVDGTSYLGKVTEMVPPKITPKFREFLAAGMSSPIDIPLGQIEKMECEFTLGTYEKEMLKQVRVTPGGTVPLVMRAGVMKDDGSKGQVIITMRGHVKEIDRGTWKPDDDTTLKISMTLSYYKEVIDGETVLEADPLNYKIMSGGVDYLAETARFIGA
ncbi:MAG: phage major tail tube protein [Flavobacteriales bacterium]